MNMPSFDVIQSALAIGIIAIVGAYLRNIPGVIVKYIVRMLVTTVVIDNRNGLFDLTIRWFDEMSYSKKCRLISAKLSPSVLGNGLSQEPANDHLLCTPAPGLHLIFFKMRPMLFYREIAISQQIVETLTISFLFSGRRCAQEFLQEMIDKDKARSYEITKIFTLDKWGDGWKHSLNQPSRSLDSIFLPKELKDSLSRDLRRFYDSKDKYAKNGIAWTRGYLLVGPPGTGKTSLIKALAHEYHLNLCLLSLVDSRLSDASLNDIIAKLPAKAALVIEDIDSFFSQRKKEDANMRVSFSGLLNALDGAAVADGRVLFLTTNHPHAIDTALMRPGRVDRIFNFALAKRPEIAQMMKSFYGVPTDFVLPEQMPENLAPALVQETMLRHPEDIVTAIAELESWGVK